MQAMPFGQLVANRRRRMEREHYLPYFKHWRLLVTGLTFATSFDEVVCSENRCKLPFILTKLVCIEYMAPWYSSSLVLLSKLIKKENELKFQ